MTLISNKIRLFFLSVFLIFFCGSSLLFAQTDFIEGKVINSTTLEPVPFATILLKNNQLGVYANADGDFKILRSQNFLTDSIVISCIGFKRYSAAYRHFSENSVNTVSLIPIIYGLGEVKILASGKKLGSLAIIGRAIRNIPKNYPLKPFSYISYYRDYQKRDGKYINLNEAIIQTLDKGFAVGSLFNNYRLLDFRKNVEFPRMNISPYYETEGYESQDTLKKFIPNATIGDQYGNELFVLMTHDAIRNFKSRSFSFIDVFSEDFIRNHNFSEPVAVYNNNQLLFKIIFSGKTRVIGNSLLVTGAVYVEPKSYAIHKIEYSCSYQAGGRGLGEMFSADIEYGRENAVDSSMCLKYISFNNFFKVVDSDDDTYFRVLKAYWEANLYINPTLVINFNNKVDPVSGSMKENYELYWGNKPLKITSLQVRDKTVFIRTKEEFIKNKSDSCYVGIHKVKDIDGNILDRKKRIDLYQFRELFVQEYNKPLVLKDSCNMEYKPIEDNCRSIYNGDEKYWMNTPVNIKISDK
jgi:hypothetical protein